MLNFLCKTEDLAKQETIVITRVRVMSFTLVAKERSRGKSIWRSLMLFEIIPGLFKISKWLVLKF